MAIQRISDLEYLESDVQPSEISDSVMEISKIDGENGEHRYRSRAMTLAKLAQIINDLNSYGDNMNLSGNVFINTNVDPNEYTLCIHMNDVALTSYNSVEVSANNVDISATGGIRLWGNGQNLAGYDVVYGLSASEPQQPQSVATKSYVDGRTFVVPFQTIMLDYIDDSLSSDGWVRNSANAWLSESDFGNSYNLLLNDYNDQQSIGKQFTIGQVTVQYRETPKGRRIAAATESNISSINSIYDETGYGWFYILDQANNSFKLPRTSNFQQCSNGEVSAVGSYVSPGLPMPPNHSHGQLNNVQDNQPCHTLTNQSPLPNGDPVGTSTTWTEDVIYGHSNTVQPPSVKLELYTRCLK